MNPYRRAERIGRIFGYCIIIGLALVVSVTMFYHFIGFRWFVAVAVGVVFVMVAYEELISIWRQKRAQWDETHKEPTP